MGSKIPTIPYSMEVPNQPEPTNCTKVRRNPQFVNYLWSSPTSEARNMRQLYSHTFKLYPNNQCYGAIKTGKSGRFIEFVTYKQVQAMVDSIGRAMQYLDLPSDAEDLHGHHLRLIGICSATRLEWEIVAIACNMYNVVLVPIVEENPLPDKLGIIAETSMECMFCSEAIAMEIAKAPKLMKLRTIILFEEPTKTIIELFKPHKIQLISFRQLLEKGEQLPSSPYPVISPTACATICYTLGTTGHPKGVMISHINITSSMAMSKAVIEKAAIQSDVHMSFIPLAHFFERINILNFFLNGAKVVFSSGDMSKFSDDIKLVKPTFMAGPSKLYHGLYTKITDEFSKLGGCPKALIDTAIETITKTLMKTGRHEHMFYDLLVARNARKELGGNMKWMASGGEILDPTVRTFLQVLFACPFIPVYGIIESTAVNFLVKNHDPSTGHVGGPGPNTEFKLVDIPDFNFLHTDKDKIGRSRPRGQLYLRGPGIFIGYFREPERTKSVKDKQGWLHTGDLAQILPENGALRIMGRKQHAFKLATGDVIVPQVVEAALFRSNLFDQICVCGDSKQKFVVAIVVPKKTVLDEIAGFESFVGSHEQLCHNMKMRRQFANRLGVLGLEQGLESFEIPKNVWLEEKTFKDRGVTSQVMFIKRHVFSEVYEQEIKAMYSEGRITDREVLHISIEE